MFIHIVENILDYNFSTIISIVIRPINFTLWQM